MDLADTIGAININKETPLSIDNFAAIIGTHHTEFIICTFQNSATYIITQFGKIGNLYSVEADQVENSPGVYHIRPLLGADDIKIEAAVRYIAGQLESKKPLLFSLSLKDYSVAHLKLIIQAILKFRD